MDIYKAILELRTERDRLTRAIEALERKGSSDEKPRKNRSWNGNARRAASERMRKYWEQRKSQPSLNGTSNADPTE